MFRVPWLLSPLLLMALALPSSRAFAQPAWDSAEPEHRPPRVETSPKRAPTQRRDDSPAWESGEEQQSEPEIAPAVQVPERTDIPSADDELDTRLQVLDAYLADIQKPVRAHYFGWMAAQVGLIGVSAALAATSDGAPRTAAIVRASISGANLGLMIITPQPGWYASQRYRKLPDGTPDERRAKLAAGQKWLAAQARVDKLATSPARHVLGAVVALGAGLAIVLAHDDGLREGITTTIGILLVSEVQIATRPRRPRLYNQHYAGAPLGPVQLSVAPLVTQHGQGLAVVGQF